MRLIFSLCLLVLSGCFIQDRSWQQTVFEEEGKGPFSIAIVSVEGEISSGKSGLLGKSDGADEVCRQLRMAETDPSVKAVILKLDTPGGDVVASDAIYQRVLAIRAAKKPVIALQGSVCASGGYYISCAADRILCGKGTITGSIGVIFIAPEIQALGEKLGVKVNTIVSGPKKDLGSPFRSMSAEERALLQTMIDQVYEQFFAVVVKGRSGHAGLPADTTATETILRPLADGRVFTGEQAVKLGLADGFGHLQDAIAEAKSLAKLKEATVFSYERQGMSIGIGLMGSAASGGVQVNNGINVDAQGLASAIRPRLAFLWWGR